MNRRISPWELAGTLFTILAGSAMHFVYEFSGENYVVGIFAGKNESVFEHIKLFFWPFVLWTIFEFIFWGRKENKFFFAKGSAAFLGVILIPTLFYTYTGILGYHVLWVDIVVFSVATAAAFIKSRRILLRRERGNAVQEFFGGLILLALAAFLVLTTIYPLSIGLYQIP